jgi:Common central domain of tyrosinase
MIFTQDSHCLAEIWTQAGRRRYAGLAGLVAWALGALGFAGGAPHVDPSGGSAASAVLEIRDFLTPPPVGSAEAEAVWASPDLHLSGALDPAFSPWVQPGVGADPTWALPLSYGDEAHPPQLRNPAGYEPNYVTVRVRHSGRDAAGRPCLTPATPQPLRVWFAVPGVNQEAGVWDAYTLWLTGTEGRVIGDEITAPRPSITGTDVDGLVPRSPWFPGLAPIGQATHTDGTRRTFLRLLAALADPASAAVYQASPDANGAPITFATQLSGLYRECLLSERSIWRGPQFLPWHRDFLARVEGLLGAAWAQEYLPEKTPLTRRLPYWSWHTPPPVFPAPSEETPTQRTLRLRYEAARTQWLAQSLGRPVGSTESPGPQPLSSDASLLAQPSFVAFWQALEEGPWREILRALRAAAQDFTSDREVEATVWNPFFLLALANVDRLWATWQQDPAHPERRTPSTAYAAYQSAAGLREAHFDEPLFPWLGQAIPGRDPAPQFRWQDVPGAAGAPWTRLSAHRPAHPSLVLPPIYDTAPCLVPALAVDEGVMIALAWVPPLALEAIASPEGISAPDSPLHTCLLAEVGTPQSPVIPGPVSLSAQKTRPRDSPSEQAAASPSTAQNNKRILRPPRPGVGSSPWTGTTHYQVKSRPAATRRSSGLLAAPTPVPPPFLGVEARPPEARFISVGPNGSSWTWRSLSGSRDDFTHPEATSPGPSLGATYAVPSWQGLAFDQTPPPASGAYLLHEFPQLPPLPAAPEPGLVLLEVRLRCHEPPFIPGARRCSVPPG